MIENKKIGIDKPSKEIYIYFYFSLRSALPILFAIKINRKGYNKIITVSFYWFQLQDQENSLKRNLMILLLEFESFRSQWIYDGKTMKDILYPVSRNKVSHAGKWWDGLKFCASSAPPPSPTYQTGDNTHGIIIFWLMYSILNCRLYLILASHNQFCIILCFDFLWNKWCFK